jgi:hypothetical protein
MQDGFDNFRIVYLMIPAATVTWQYGNSGNNGACYSLILDDTGVYLYAGGNLEDST